jgi:hypothetical protein
MEIISVLKNAVMISFFVFVMMLFVDFIETASRRRISDVMKAGVWRQYTLASFLGSTPGCLGAFMNVSLYIHGMISFGAVVGGMIATSGDEAFIMLIQFPDTALFLFILLFISGIFFAWVSDNIIKRYKLNYTEPCLDSNCEKCLATDDSIESTNYVFKPINFFKNLHLISFPRFLLQLILVIFLILISTGMLGAKDWDWKRITFIALSLSAIYIIGIVSEHYLNDHIWNHIIKRHLFSIFVWSFCALLFIKVGLHYLSLETILNRHMFWVLIISALFGIIPESGPHLIFVMMYAEGLIPFSVLFTISFVQDGHGMLPLLSHSIKDSVLIKSLNIIYGLGVGLILFAAGL